MDRSYRLLAARYIRKQTRQLVAQLDGVRKAEDAEYVHQARVASRRLRAGLELFPECFPRKKAKRWRKQIRRLTQGLGPARDRDVQIEFVRNVLSGLSTKAHRPGIARLLLRLEQGRAAMQPGVIRAVERFEAKGAAEEMLAAAQKVRSELKKRHQSIQSPFIFAKARDHIAERLNELMLYEDSLADPQDREHHHALRIAAKRLRYTMEICQPAYGGRLEPYLKAVKAIQTLLGDVHDCDLWVDFLAAFMEEEQERTVAYYGHARPFRSLKVGLEYLRRQRQQRRQELFDQLVEYWRKLDQEGLWEDLLHTVTQAAEAEGTVQEAERAEEAEETEKPEPGQPGPKPTAEGDGGDGRPLGVDLKRDGLDVRGSQAEASRAAGPLAASAGSPGPQARPKELLLGVGKPAGIGQ